MRATLDAMDASIGRLDHLFSAQDGVKRLMERSGTLLQSRVRGLVVRNRFKRARAGLRRWRSQNDGGLSVVAAGHCLRRAVQSYVQINTTTAEEDGEQVRVRQIEAARLRARALLG